MQEKLKVITIGDYKDSTLENYFKDSKNIEFLELTLNEGIEKLNSKLFNREIVFLRSKEDNLEKLLEVGRALKEKEIITTTILEEKLVMENKEDLKKSIDAIFPVNKKGDIENLLLELLKMIDNMLKDSGITVFGSLKINKAISEEVIIKNINYPFYSKILKDSKKILIFLDTLEDVELTESEVITDILKNESSKNIEDLLFSIRIDNNLKNRIECSFIAGKFQK